MDANRGRRSNKAHIALSAMIKYPRTFHLPSSQGATNDDKILRDTSHFVGKRVVITEKRDGENSSLYRDHFHARSLDSRNHPSRNWLKNFHGQIKSDIPEGYRVCGENLYAKHSIEYNNLSSYFECFSIWNENNVCLGWEDTVEWCDVIGIELVPVWYIGVWDDANIENIATDVVCNGGEGIVVRLEGEFHYDDFGVSVAKWVRANHVQTDKHWMHSEIVKNKLRSSI